MGKRWLAKWRASGASWLLMPLLFGLAAGPLLGRTEFAKYLRNAVELAFDFKVRKALGKEPVVSDRLKILVFDDSTADSLSVTDLQDEHWIKLLRALQAEKPALIVMDKIFLFGVADEARRAEFLALKAGDAPLAAGAFLNPGPHGSRQVLDRERDEFHLRSYLSSRDDGAIVELDWLPERQGYLYGPDPGILPAFSKVGQLSYLENGFFEPMMRIGESTVVPHVSLFAGKDVELRADGVYAEGERIPTVDGKTLINFVSADALRSRAFSLAPVFKRIDQGRELSAIKEGDLVLVMPLGAVGNRDSYDSPFGRILGGYILAAELNSFLTNQWLSSYGHPGLSVFLASLLGLLLGRMSRSGRFAVALAAATVTWIAASLGAFTYLSVDLPWLMPSFAFGTTALIRHLRTVFYTQVASQVFRQALHRLVSEEKLDDLAKNPRQVALSPQEQVISILFFDLVGFSLVSETRTPREIFLELKAILRLICDTVYEFGGMVDKILGDGALCIFGFSLDAKEQSTDHADQAVACALAIQRRMLEANLKAAENAAIFPIRVGIHSAPAFMGDLGSGGKIEFTVIGPGVNFAKRLEEACEPYRIMISAATRDIMQADQQKLATRIIRRDVGIKHHNALFEAYELDPFRDDPAKLGEGLKQHSVSRGRQRESERHLLPAKRRFPVYFPMGSGFIEDYSRTGMRLSVSFYVSCGVQTVMNVEEHDCPLYGELNKHRLTQIQVLVKWGKPIHASRFSLGVQFIGLSPALCDSLIEVLSQQQKVVDVSA